jgi:hypothetical protein
VRPVVAPQDAPRVAAAVTAEVVGPLRVQELREQLGLRGFTVRTLRADIFHKITELDTLAIPFPTLIVGQPQKSTTWTFRIPLNVRARAKILIRAWRW